MYFKVPTTDDIVSEILTLQVLSRAFFTAFAGFPLLETKII